MEQEPNSRKLLRIHKDDNVLIVVKSVQPGDKDVSEGYEIVFTQRIAIGHKVASRLIERGEKIYKCGVPIGSANSFTRSAVSASCSIPISQKFTVSKRRH